jgi:hypothetical protein
VKGGEKMKIKQIENLVETLEKKRAEIQKELESLEEKKRKFIEEKIREAGEKIVGKYFSPDIKKVIVELDILQRKIKDADPAYCDEKGNIKEEIWNKKSKLKKMINEDKVLEELAKASTDAEKIVAAYYLSDIGAIIGGCSGFGYHKDPSTCGRCVSGQKTAAKLDIERYYEYLGDREYRIPEKTKIASLEEVLGIKIDVEIKKLKMNDEELKRELEKLDNEIKELKEKKSAYWALSESGVDYERVEKEMPEFFDEIININNRNRTEVNFATVDLENNVGIALANSWNYYGSGGCEYGVTVIVFRDGNTKEEYFKYRDPYDPKRDNWSYAFEEAEIIKITNTQVKIRLKSNREGPFSIERTFELPKSQKSQNKSEVVLTKEEQEEFKKRCEEIEKELLKQHERPNAMMPDYINMWGMSGSIPSFPGMITGQMVPYDRPEVIDRYIDIKTGKAAIVIKAQIDHCAGWGKQYAWIGYIIDRTGAKQVYYETAYQLQIKQGKRVEIKAKNLL